MHFCKHKEQFIIIFTIDVDLITINYFYNLCIEESVKLDKKTTKSSDSKEGKI